MIKQVADLHIHSKYSRACSPNLELGKIAKACETKGVQLVATGDFTHPIWFKQIQNLLVEKETKGVFTLKDGSSKTKFILGTEVACIYKHKSKVRRLHLLVYSPGINEVKVLNKTLEKRGVNLNSDGRPIMGISGRELVKICKEISENMHIVPAHIWTPWFSVFGSKSGYNSLEECFEDSTSEIFALETGLSSDLEMNRSWSALDSYALISNSDAHSLEKIGREANVLYFNDENDVTYNRLWQIIKNKNNKEFSHTIEFFPEEGMYHFDGHRSCLTSTSPEESILNKLNCPKCGKKLTIGVLHRVKELSDRKHAKIVEVRQKKILPLSEILAACYKVGVKSKRVEKEYNRLISMFGDEFNVLLDVPKDDLLKVVDKKTVGIIMEMREEKINVIPGYDGVYGKLSIN